MGSASRQALASSTSALADLGGTVELADAEGLFAAGRVIGDSAQLRAALADASAGTASKRALITNVFGETLPDAAITLLTDIAAGRWSDEQDLLSAIEELGIRAAAASTKSAVETELFGFGGTVASNPQLELALGSKLGRPQAKAELAQTLLAGKASEATIAIVRHLVMQPRGRSVRIALRDATTIVAAQAGLSIATVTVAGQISETQLNRLAEALSERYGKRLTINVVVDPAVIGGMRVQIGDDVIDGSIANRLSHLKLSLAG